MPRRIPSRLSALILLAILWAPTGGCVYHRHRIGNGPNGVHTETVRQYYMFFGLLRLNEADTQRLTNDVASYEILTEFSFLDLLLSPLLLPLTVTTRTVTVNR